jgi:hypothetical protein
VKRLLLQIAPFLYAMAATAAWASSPHVTQMTPAGGQRGHNVEVVIEGNHLAEAHSLVWYGSGITVAPLAVESNERIKVMLTISDACQLGPHGFRIFTNHGISNLFTFSIGALPESVELEPNNDFSLPQPIAVNATVNGTIPNEDVDYFSFTGKRGERINIEVEGLRLGHTFFDPYVAVFDTQRFEIARSDDASLVRQDCLCSFVLPTDGVYVIQVRESSFQGEGVCKYRLHLGTFPRPTAMIPYGGRPGDTLMVRWLGDAMGIRDEQITIPSSARQYFDFFPQNAEGVAPTANRFVVSDLPGILEIEPNGDSSSATQVPVPIAVHGTIGGKGDIDEFKFKARRGDELEVRVLARDLGSPLDPVLIVSRRGGGELGRNDDAGHSADCYVRARIPDDDEYVVQVRDHLSQGSSSHAYRIEIDAPRRKLAFTLPERQPLVDTTLSIARGNRYAILVAATREEFDGNIQLEFEDLPRGIEAQQAVIPQGEQSVPVLFTATNDAEITGALANIIGHSNADKRTVQGQLRQRTMLVRGFENRDLWHFDGDRLAVAVVDESPFRLEMAEPKAALVSDSSLDLKVVARRQPGFVTPITLKLLYLPTGLVAKDIVEIATNQNDALFTISATQAAALGNWKMVVLGEALVNGKLHAASTQLTNLTVAEPYALFQLQPASIAQGVQSELVVKIDKRRDWKGTAKIELLGLPHGVTAEPLVLIPDTTQVAFKLIATKNSPIGLHKSIVGRVEMLIDGELITHRTDGGEIRITEPHP